jgi:hypothetical protein
VRDINYGNYLKSTFNILNNLDNFFLVKISYIFTVGKIEILARFSNSG